LNNSNKPKLSQNVSANMTISFISTMSDANVMHRQSKLAWRLAESLSE
jgi:hypothetical protein